MSTMLLRKIVLLICVGCLSTTALAADVNWDGGTDPNDSFWGTADNWDTDTVPTAVDAAYIAINGPDVVIPAGESYATKEWHVGHYSNNTLYVAPGATLSNTGRSVIGREAGSSVGVVTVDGTLTGGQLQITGGNGGTGTLIVNEGGVVTNSLMVYASWGGPTNATLILNGGLVDSGQMDPYGSIANVTLDLNDGTYDCGYLNPSTLGLYDGTGSLLVDIDHGKWVISGNRTSDVDTMLGRGEIIAFGGVGTVVRDYDVTTPGKTTVYATHPLDQDPVWKDFVLVPTAGGTTTLEWDNYVDPNHTGATVTATVWLGTLEAGATEPNKLGSNYSTVFSQAVTPGTPSSITSPTLTPTQDYYWQVDFDNGGPSIIEGPVFKFLVTDNKIPVVSVKDVYAWLDAGEAVIPMDATATDDDTLTYAWTLEPVGDPNVAFDSTTIVDPNITVSRVDTYTLTLTVDDDFWDPVSASAEVFVGWNPCHAARLTPDYGGDPAGNIVESLCVVDFADFAALAATWLDNTSLTEIAYY